ncbi:hypothetical protein Clacol_004142 [Clathrus columnatus]|uniref:Uncharacterized protein n=1 Tax=Clathrus columnatus TaxID=1419009 RepID=A0AAV5A8Y1_9AGAM|nr:hypothetical protein Clacol_004142 [Clathrus columnatus]
MHPRSSMMKKMYNQADMRRFVEGFRQAQPWHESILADALNDTAAYVDLVEGTLSQSKKGFVFTIVPPKNDGEKREDDPDGWSVCFVDGIAKGTILDTPGFPRPLLHPTRPSYWVTTAQHMGLGVFAKRLIKMGEIILSERPLIVVPETIDATLRQFGGSENEEARLGLMAEWERPLQNCINMMDEQDRQELLKLRNAYQNDGSGPYLGIIRTNGYEVKPLKFKEGDLEDGYSAICKDIARLNHRKIPSYEQICIDYCDILLPATARQEQLAKKKITCTCPACTGDTTKGDRFRTSLERRISEIQANYKIWSKDFTLSDNNYVLDPALSLLAAIEDEDLEKAHVYGKLLVVVNNIYTSLGDLDNALKYGKMVSAWHKKDYGPDNVMTRLEDPEYYPTRPEWNIRAKKRAELQATS